VPFYPVSPIIALVIASVALIAMIIYNFNLSLVFFGILVGSFIVSNKLKSD
jgi:ethanolamine permease